MQKSSIIRSIYFYAVAIISLFMVVFSLSDLINSGLKTWVFPNADPRYNECIPGVNYGSAPAPVIAAPVKGKEAEPTGPTKEECDRQNKLNQDNLVRERQNSAVRDISLLVVGLPLFLFHFKVVQKEWKERKEA
jgi:hypothetical protein